MWSFNFWCNKLRYRLLFIVILGGKKYRLAVLGTDIVYRYTSRIIWLGGCFTLWIVYFLSYLFPLGHRTLNTSKNKILLHCCIVQFWYCLVKVSRFFFITGVSRDFLAGLWDNKQKSLVKRLEIVLELMLVPFAARERLIVLQELVRLFFLSYNHHMH